MNGWLQVGRVSRRRNPTAVVFGVRWNVGLRFANPTYSFAGHWPLNTNRWVFHVQQTHSVVPGESAGGGGRRHRHRRCRRHGGTRHPPRRVPRLCAAAGGHPDGGTGFLAGRGGNAARPAHRGRLERHVRRGQRALVGHRRPVHHRRGVRVGHRSRRRASEGCRAAAASRAAVAGGRRGARHAAGGVGHGPPAGVRPHLRRRRRRSLRTRPADYLRVGHPQPPAGRVGRRLGGLRWRRHQAVPGGRLTPPAQGVRPHPAGGHRGRRGGQPEPAGRGAENFGPGIHRHRARAHHFAGRPAKLRHHDAGRQPDHHRAGGRGAIGRGAETRRCQP